MNVKLVAKFGGPVVLLGLFVIFSITLPGTFLTSANLQSMLSAQAVPGILALGLLLPLTAREFDFSGGVIATASSVAMVTLMGELNIHWAVSSLIVLAGAACVGAFSGFLIAVLGYGSFVATLAVGGMIAGFTLLKSKGATLYEGVSEEFIGLGQAKVLGLPSTVWALIVIFVVVAYLLSQTAWGRYHEAIGKGRVAVELAGVSIKKHVFMAFVGSATISAFAGIVMLSRLGSAPAGAADGFVLASFAAAFLGQLCCGRDSSTQLALWLQ